MTILSLLYVSRMAMAADGHRIAELADRAARNNAANGITGLLLWNHAHFMQLLEGGTQAVMETMARIAADSRHADIVYLRTEERPARECDGWAMRALLTPLTGAGMLSDFAEALPPGVASDSRTLFTSFASAMRPLAE